MNLSALMYYASTFLMYYAHRSVDVTMVPGQGLLTAKTLQTFEKSRSSIFWGHLENGPLKCVTFTTLKYFTQNSISSVSQVSLYHRGHWHMRFGEQK